MIVYFDEHIPKHLVEGFSAIQKFEGLKSKVNVEIKYIPTEFSYGVKDPDWLRALEKKKSFVITQDVNISRRKHEMEIYQEQKIGLFFLKGKSKKQGLSVWEMVEALAKRWPEIIEKIINEKPPFAYEVKLKGKIKKVA